MKTVKLSLLALTVLLILLSIYSLVATSVLIDGYVRSAVQQTAQYGAEQFSIQLTAQVK